MTITFTIGETPRNIDMPTSWNDLITEDDLGVRHPEKAMTILQVLQGPGDLTSKRISILMHLLGLSSADIDAWKIDRAIEHGKEWELYFYDEIDQLLAATDFLLEPDGQEQIDTELRRFQLNPTMTRCPFPALHGMRSSIKHSKTTYSVYAPSDGLENINAEELALLFDLYEAYAASKDVKLLDKLIATLYRKGKEATPEQLDNAWYGDRRQPYHFATVPLRQSQIAEMPVMVKNTIFFWFMSCRMTIIAKWPGIFKEGDGKERQGADYGWAGIFRSLAGSILDTEKLMKLNAGDVLFELDYLESQRLEREAQQLLAQV
jgi:hypothetical protein